MAASVICAAMALQDRGVGHDPEAFTEMRGANRRGGHDDGSGNPVAKSSEITPDHMVAAAEESRDIFDDDPLGSNNSNGSGILTPESRP